MNTPLTRNAMSKNAMSKNAMSKNVRVLIALLCCAGALEALAACSTTSSAQGNDAAATTATETTRKPSTTVEAPPTTRPSTRPDTTIRETTVPPTTVPDTSVQFTTTTLPPNVEYVGPWLGTPLTAVGKDDGPATAAAQLRLNQLGFWTGDADGEYGFATTQAVMAFQKYLGLEASGKLDDETASWLTSFPERAHGASDDGTLVEVDKGKQLLFLIVDGKTTWTFNTSTGSEIAYSATNRNTGEIETGDAVTPDGLWKVNRERPNGWWEGDLGDIYRPKYFRGGIAIHGMTRVPNTPVSHGCVRLSVAAMDFIWDNDLIPLYTPVWVHE
jgi:peptidoglycan hydrolase-like protein with peptidoglycan-binding domain